MKTFTFWQDDIKIQVAANSLEDALTLFSHTYPDLTGNFVVNNERGAYEVDYDCGDDDIEINPIDYEDPYEVLGWA